MTTETGGYRVNNWISILEGQPLATVVVAVLLYF